MPFATPPAPPPVAVQAAGPRLTLVVAPGRIRPRRLVNIRVTDRLGKGGVSGTVCARGPASAGQGICKTVRVVPGQRQARIRIRVGKAGRWAFSLRSASGAVQRRSVDVRPGRGLKVVVAGDSMIYGIFDVLGRFVKKADGGSAPGDPHPGSGVTKPLLNWPAYAPRAAARDAADVTFLMIGAANDTQAIGTAVCCGPEWIEAYADRVERIMRAYLRGGRGLVYWGLLPAPRIPADNPRKAVEYASINQAVEQAAARFPDGVTVIREIADTIAPGGVFTESIVYKGRSQVVRLPDGYHMDRPGLRISASIILRQLRADGLL